MIELSSAIRIVGWGHFCILIASALVPLRLDWRHALSPLPKLLRQLVWVYGGYVVLSIVGLGTICVLCAEELASGTTLARAVCAYAAIFWGIRLTLQPFLAARPFLTTWWLRGGYHLLSLLFVTFVSTFLWGAIR